MIRILFLIIFISNVQAAFFSESQKYKDLNLQKTGETKLNYFIFSVYRIAHYQKPGHTLIHIKYLMDVSQKYSLMGWERGFKNLDNIEDKMKWFAKHTPNMKKGDSFKIWKIAPHTTILEKNGNIIAKSKDKKIYEMAHYTWIGNKPIDNKLKNELLGKHQLGY